MKTFLHKIAAVLLFLLPVASYGAVLVSNTITDSNPSAANPYVNGQTTDLNVTSTGIGRGAGLIANPGSNRFNATTSQPAANVGAAVTNSKYFSFVISPRTNYSIAFTDFPVTYQVSTTGPTNYSIRSSADGYVADITTGAFTRSGNPVALTVDLSGAAYQNVTAQIEFRIFVYGGSTGTVSINDYSFNGTASLIVATPVTLERFSAQPAGNTALLSWVAHTTGDASSFAVERSADGEHFTTINTQAASTATTAYTYTDKELQPGQNFYRLRITDGAATAYSPVQTVVGNHSNGFALTGIAPNVIRGNATVLVTDGTDEIATLRITDLSSRVVATQTSALHTGDNLLPLDASMLHTGQYMLQLSTAGGATAMQRFIKQ